MKTGAQIVGELLALSVKFPDVELYLKIVAGDMSVMIPKGERGDALAAAWGEPQAMYIPEVSAERN